MSENQEETAQSEVDQMVEDGLAALEDEQFEVATELFRRVIQRAPFRHDARDYLAFALDRQFARESGRTKTGRARAVLGSSSAAAATSGRARPARIRFPAWLSAGALALVIFVVTVVALARRYDLREWVRDLGKPPTHPVAEQIAADLQKADSAATRQQFDEALKILSGARETAASLDPPDPKLVEDKIAEVYAAKAEFLRSKQNYPKALEAAQEGLKYNASLPQLNYLLGFCYFQQGLDASNRENPAESRRSYERASRALEKAVDGDPSHLRALDCLAKSYIKINKPTKAVETWKRIIKQASGSREAKAARDYLRTLGFKNP